MRILAALMSLLVAGAAGSQEATYLVRGDQLPVPVVANGYVQSVTAASAGAVRVRVATPLTPIGASGSYERIRQSPRSPIPDLFEMPPSVRTRLRGDREAFAVATSVLQWVALNLSLDDDHGPQDAVSVLRWRRGRCSGIANATAALLLAAGFEARTVSGLLISEDGAMAHRWVECALPGAGWVPTDPTLGLWVVTPGHMSFADTVREMPEVVVEEPSAPHLGRLPRWRGRPLRPNRGSELVCRLVDGSDGATAIAILYGGEGEVHRAILSPEARFEHLLPGRWRLVVVRDGRRMEYRDLVLAANQVYTFNVAPPPAATGGEVGL